MLIDVSYFVAGSRHIQNASISNTAGADSLAVKGVIESYIKELQPVFLDAMLGEKEASYAMDFLDMPVGEDAGGEPSKYEAVCDKLKEPFADFVLYHILRDASSEATITGNVRLKCANEYISPVNAQVVAWNRMVSANVKFIQWARDGNCPIDLVTQTNMLNKINRFNL
ncbi:hypothetical protein [Bacteroides sp. ET225]|uniref:hypothetical protein n=1 Tax=Bacteroides sp. ET225 TaxID=2972461 RepID=UPI0021AD04BA|nr:hypothetical protein [Bacteroides sp. ET225]MCR8919192.1 hypothetical protein [Bacteroides sp. ET225]